jgi:hypothetical protein
MQIITHDRRMILPSTPRRKKLSVSVQIRHGIRITLAAHYANQFGPKIVYHDAKPALAIDNLIESMLVFFEGPLFEAHKLTCGSIDHNRSTETS